MIIAFHELAMKFGKGGFDAAAYYSSLGEFAEHSAVNHAANEYVRGDVHTNTVEGYFSIFKRGMKGVYQHCSEKHLLMHSAAS